MPTLVQLKVGSRIRQKETRNKLIGLIDADVFTGFLGLISCYFLLSYPLMTRPKFILAVF